MHGKIAYCIKKRGILPSKKGLILEKLIFEFFEYEFFVEPQIFGLVASTIGMILGSNIKTKIN